jgi:hypothetical protein
MKEKKEFTTLMNKASEIKKSKRGEEVDIDEIGTLIIEDNI